MGKINQALEKKGILMMKGAPPKKVVKQIYEPAIRTFPIELSFTETQKYDAIKIKLSSYYATKSIKTILFTGASKGCGVTTVSLNFAFSLSQDPQAKILIVDANLRDPKLHEIFNMEYDQVLSYMQTPLDATNSIFKQIKENLFVLVTDNIKGEYLTSINPYLFQNFIRAARQAFSFVVLDGPSLSDFLDPLLLCSNVDGVLLVVEAGKTRSYTALAIKNELQCAGANLLGAVINKRKYFVPQWLYNLI